MATGQVGEVWVAGGAAEFTSGNIPGGGGSQAASSDPPEGFLEARSTYCLLSRT